MPVCAAAIMMSFLAGTEPPRSGGDGDYVVLLHGIGRGSEHMRDLETYLGARGYDVLNLDYPSTDHSLAGLADLIQQQLDARMTDDKPVHFVGYSLGGLLVRAVIHRYRPETLGRVVQLGTPNGGSEVADFLKENWLYQEIYGPAGQQLTTDQRDVAGLLGTVDYELGAIAGINTIDPVSSAIIPGADDGKVSVRSTMLEGMADHLVVPVSHFFMPMDDAVHLQTARFLAAGAFER